MLLSFILCNFLVRMLKYFKKILRRFFAHKMLKKPPQEVAYLWQLGVFFSAAPTAQNSPELHFRFINSFIQPSFVGSLAYVYSAHLFSMPLKDIEQRTLLKNMCIKNQFVLTLVVEFSEYFGVTLVWLACQ